MEKLLSKARGLTLAAPVALMAAPAFAGDLADAVTAKVTESSGEIQLIGVAIIGLVVAIVAFSWIRRVIK